MASIATAATRAELVTLSGACSRLERALQEVLGGTGTPAAPGRLTAVQVDTLITALTTAITAATT